MVSKNATQIVSMFVESVLYGIYLVTFFTAISTILLRSRETRKLQAHWLIVVAAVLIFGCATLNISTGLARLIEAFEPNVAVADDGAVERLGANSKNLIRTLALAIQTLLVNAMLMFRCWIVWEKSFAVLIIPLLLWLAAAACTIALAILEGMKVISTPTQGKASIRWPLVILALCISLNFYGTGMIIYRILSVQYRSAAIHRLSRFQHTLRIVIDSALLQALTSLIWLVGLATRSYPTCFIASAAEMQVAGIAYNLILIRIIRDRSASHTNKEPTSTLYFSSISDRSPRVSGSFSDTN